MNRVIAHALLVMISTGMMGCASTGAYLKDRGRDAADIVTLTAGVGLGAGVRCSAFQTGLGAYCDGVGLRNGSVFFGPLFFTDDEDDLQCDFNYILLGGTMASEFNEVVRARGKAVDAYTALFVIPAEDFLGAYHDKRPVSYYTQIEVTFGAIVGARVGFNPGELVDFLLGWATIDIFDDDLEAKKRKAVELWGHPYVGCRGCDGIGVKVVGVIH